MNVYVDKDRLVLASKSVVEFGADEPVVLRKEYGPLVFYDVRITALLDSNEWLIEREDSNGDFREVARFDGDPDSEDVI
jgi:hypothetical protein